ncbi:MAG: carbohydrate ABC transporter permease [Candidatus Sumerlaeaceae bacterium]|nr:carbohydrate ABC transporter permease [Candidatus Sumerlaeaceae bacterium]
MATTDRARTLVSDVDLRSTRTRILYWLVFSVLCLGAVTTVVPLLWGFLSALKPTSEIFGYPPTFLPKPAARPWEWQWGVYAEVFGGSQFVRYFWNTFLLAVGCWVAAIVPSAMAGYALSKLRTPCKWLLLLLFFMTLMVPFQAYLVPLFLTVRDLPLVGWNLMQVFAGYPAIILPAGVSAFNIFLFKSFFDDIPTSLVEAARIDGASEAGILWRIVLPLSYSVFAVVSIFSFMGTWNDFLWPLLVINDNQWKTIMLHLYQYDLQGDIGKNKVLAALMIASLPPLTLFALFQKRIMSGIAMTGVKF